MRRPDLIIGQPELGFDRRKNGAERLPVGVIEKPAEPQEPDGDPWIIRVRAEPATDGIASFGTLRSAVTQPRHF